MDFFLEIHNGECGLGGHFFFDHQRDHGPKGFDWKTKTKKTQREKNNELTKKEPLRLLI